MRARLALDVSSQSFDAIEVALRDKPAMLHASPKGTVPVLIDTDGTVIDESLDIMLWTLRRSDPEQWLAPERDDFATMHSLIRSPGSTSSNGFRDGDFRSRSASQNFRHWRPT
jgi:glutathione S-transferase